MFHFPHNCVLIGQLEDYTSQSDSDGSKGGQQSQTRVFHRGPPCFHLKPKETSSSGEEADYESEVDDHSSCPSLTDSSNSGEADSEPESGVGSSISLETPPLFTSSGSGEGVESNTESLPSLPSPVPTSFEHGVRSRLEGESALSELRLPFSQSTPLRRSKSESGGATEFRPALKEGLSIK